MAGVGLLALLDDATALLDEVAIYSRLAAKKKPACSAMLTPWLFDAVAGLATGTLTLAAMPGLRRTIDRQGQE
jgi:hypothetical protein